MSDFMRERYMVPRWARFLSRDPMGFGAGSTNLYTYAGNSPTNFTDPLGLESGFIDIVIGFFSGGGGEGPPPPPPSGPPLPVGLTNFLMGTEFGGGAGV